MCQNIRCDVFFAFTGFKGKNLNRAWRGACTVSHSLKFQDELKSSAAVRQANPSRALCNPGATVFVAVAGSPFVSNLPVWLSWKSPIPSFGRLDSGQTHTDDAALNDCKDPAKLIPTDSAAKRRQRRMPNSCLLGMRASTSIQVPCRPWTGRIQNCLFIQILAAAHTWEFSTSN